jgi:endo-1,4-beta-xylanase
VTYTSVLNRDFDYVTAEYEMKWAPIEGTQGVNNFSGGDAIVSYAQAHGLQVKGHTLLWHGSVPSWVNGLSATDLKTAVDNHIAAVAQHYRGKVLAWDVVNEAVADDGSGLRNTIFLQGLGTGYIADAFRLAHEADPAALLFYNDYGGEGLGAKSDAIYNLVKGLRDQGVPIDGVGLQMHISANSRPADSSIQSNMRRLAALGLFVNISEMDVKINGVSGSEATKLDTQRTTYRAVVADCVMEPKCQAVTFWGFTDAHTWISGDQPLLYDTVYAAKPAYYGVADAVSGQ